MKMKNFKVELLFVALGLLISLIFVFNPMPFWMAAFRICGTTHVPLRNS